MDNKKTVLLSGIIGVMMLSACASTPNPLTSETRDQFFVKSTAITWDLSEKEQKIEDKKDTKDQGERAEGRKQLTDKLRVAIDQEFQNSPSGPTPVNFNVSVLKYDRVGLATGNIIGGSNLLVADVFVMDANTDQQLAIYQDISGHYTSNFGLVGAVVQAASKPDITAIMAKSFAGRLRKVFEGEKVRVRKET